MSKTRNYLHIVFGTKYRQRTITLTGREKLYSYISGIIKNKKSTLISINGIEDHVHILLNLHPTIALADMVRDIKSEATKMIIETKCFPMYEGWASEYFASSVSPSHVESVKAYIDNQEEHHKSKGYEEEVKGFLQKMGMTLYTDDLD
ncbi:MAG: IS200/IS605 family transposase [Muribaculaceae bacterium]|nr:IS200/IS605 family transposase [Muribaculaceae bacterium]